MITFHDDDVRIIMKLPEDQIRQLRHLCRVEKISRAEAIRRAVDRLLWQAVPADSGKAFGLWKSRAVGGRTYVEALRQEWGK